MNRKNILIDLEFLSHCTVIINTCINKIRVCMLIAIKLTALYEDLGCRPDV